MEINEKNGSTKVLGMDIQLNEVIADSIATQWISHLSKEDLEAIYEQIDKYALESEYKYNNGDDREKIMYNILKQYGTDEWGHKKETDLWKIVNSQISKQFGEKIEEEVKRILSLDETKEKVNKMAQDIIDYALEGYKKDMIDRIRERMVSNILDDSVYYGGTSLLSIINREIDKRFSNGGY